jgi:hypothetical protein
LDQILALLQTLVTQGKLIMATVADVQAALASSETKEATIIGLLTTEAQLQKDTLAQLQALQASGSTDPAALQTIVDKMTADNANMDAAIASVQPPPPAAA